MKEYIRPEIEVVNFNTEAIASEPSGSGTAEDNDVLSGELT